MDQPNPHLGESPSQRQPRILRWPLILLALITLLYHMEANSILAIGPILSYEFHLTDTQLAVVTNAAVLCVALFAIPLAIYADRRARIPLLVGGLVVWAGLTGVRGSATGFLLLVALCAPSGIGLASYLAPASALIYDFYPPKLRSQALGIQGAGQSLGTLLGFVLPGVLTLYLDWRIIFVGIALFALVLVIPLLRLREPQRGAFDEPRRSPERHSATRGLGDGARHIVKSRAALVGILGFGAQTFGVGGIASFLPVYLVRYFATWSAAADGLVAVVVLAMVLGAVLGGFVDAWLRGRSGMGSHSVLAGSATLALSLLFAGALWLPLLPFLALTTMSGILLGLTIAPLTMLLGEAVHFSHRSFAYALQVAVAALCQTGGGLAVGALSDQLQSLQFAYLVFSGVLALVGGWMISQFRAVGDNHGLEVIEAPPVRMRQLFSLPLRRAPISPVPAAAFLAGSLEAPSALQTLEPSPQSSITPQDVPQSKKKRGQPKSRRK